MTLTNVALPVLPLIGAEHVVVVFVVLSVHVVPALVGVLDLMPKGLSGTFVQVLLHCRRWIMLFQSHARFEGVSCTNGMLTVTDASIEDVQGLSGLNKELLRQRGAIGEPENLLHGASKKIAVMASVVSKLKPLSNETAWGSSSSTNRPDKQPGESEISEGPYQ